MGGAGAGPELGPTSVSATRSSSAADGSSGADFGSAGGGVTGAQPVAVLAPPGFAPPALAFISPVTTRGPRDEGRAGPSASSSAIAVAYGGRGRPFDPQAP